MRHVARALLGCALLLAACESDVDKVEQAAAIAKEIKASPNRSEEILAEHEMTIEQFEALMYEIAGDEEMSNAYKAALEGGGESAE